MKGAFKRRGDMKKGHKKKGAFKRRGHSKASNASNMVKRLFNYHFGSQDKLCTHSFSLSSQFAMIPALFVSMISILRQLFQPVFSTVIPSSSKL